MYNPQPIRVLLENTNTEGSYNFIGCKWWPVTVTRGIFEVLENKVLKYTSEFKKESVAGGLKKIRYVMIFLMYFACVYDASIKKTEIGKICRMYGGNEKLVQDSCYNTWKKQHRSGWKDINRFHSDSVCEYVDYVQSVDYRVKS